MSSPMFAITSTIIKRLGGFFLSASKELESGADEARSMKGPAKAKQRCRTGIQQRDT